MKKNVILVGMPGVGKSTIGVLLAKNLGMDFVDTDLVIQNRTGEKLQTTLERVGVKGLLDEEEQAILAFSASHPTVIATGGSAVLREASMVHLLHDGICVYLYLPCETIEHRIHNRGTRGIAAEGDETLADIYAFRTPYYEKYAGLTVDCCGKSAEENALDIEKKLGETEKL